ncbi:2-succinyl-5-enolpyruvyl-6-hydroxy-3-cyclohexene-1-carboxylic-acid synthase [Dietzia cinnamea]|uniref:2-succinyl-5-enolpyruvyl-6-hydroxy-3-cyclohexene-1-carboxylate synthase n=1 Tax=Dietzia cinnamea TaxID=321318 RepID=A0ABV3YEZ3_9ACTN|nr:MULTISPECIES: 2-succinyl-5-enolpyruvyl-6-hydroxy-3-cyclohexene-1-carboxylic-acid synthase [Dietzia]AVM63380.1 2-succinyl-5-enolpyruvyl-6-hydroxy-3-cyclohexene-1-carboxylic-acid synthase [Dietzia sp. oral taxon 368]MCT1639538.1 2-succinyl-5-enolpyruvyl-6-hydroxy-3-cyclohexene-1-carboxylic-acid synthase [Dietzia cinnamea]MCT1884258.1 2-succinyl-5-enolpyruvyl-6-hydroxy-3-cyclohexene-1-carboxylic-acid synthase [Dietzia cinnamea]MCT2099054.1 2-succinyl-5-enolpyruvyl-6-hydroxy-3-cyclohexene-1-carb
MTATPSNPSTAQARVLVDEMVRHGITDAVLCPGSRSAPLALALAAAERAGRIALHVRIDERGAGFTALGLALGSKRPVPVVVTSGTAVANLHPAMVEAAHSGVPVLALTANRPPELRGTGANQTIDQVGLFGPHARAVVELGAAGDPVTEHRHWRSAIGRAILTATAAADPGPVQVDIAFREPLVPGEGDEEFVLGGGPGGYDDEVDPGGGSRDLPEGRPGGRPWVQRAGAGVDSAPAASAVAVDLTRPTLVVSGVGAAPVSGLVGVPTVAEPGAPVPLHPVHPLAIPSLRPEQVVVTGRPTLHRSVTRLLADPEVDLVILDAGPRSPNPTGSAAELADSVLTGWGVEQSWTETTSRADAHARAAVDRLLDEHLDGGSPTGLHVARAVVRGVRAGDNLVVGASNAVRDLSFVGPIDPDVSVYANRGASGIDGTVSTAIGVALSAPGRTVALLGDLTFLHDISGLLLGPRERHPSDLLIVVADDDGGGIFSLLEQGDPRLAADFERVFGTPHGANLGALCAGAGVPFTDTDPAGLEAILAQPSVPVAHHDIVPEGPRVVRVGTDRQGLRELHAALRSEAVEPGTAGSATSARGPAGAGATEPGASDPG